MSAKLEGIYESLITGPFFLFDGDEPYFQEQLLQIIWNEQLVRQPLRTESGSVVEVIHPGTWNVAAGPDFHDAIIVIDGKRRDGAVEIHLRPESWHAHQHHRNSDYGKTILHVVWENPHGHDHYPEGVALCALSNQLTQPIHEILAQYDVTMYPYSRKVYAGGMATAFAAMDDTQVTDILYRCGMSRLLNKAQALSAAIIEGGLETCAYRALLDVLGYKSHREAFATLSSILPLSDLQAADAATAEAMLFGAAGLLPDPTRKPVAPELRDWVNDMWQRWWPQQHAYHPITWSRKRSRPLNSPERRVLAAHLLLSRNRYRLGRQLIEQIDQATSCRAALRNLKTFFSVDASPPKDRFYNFERFLGRPAQLLGNSRTADLIVNLAIPLYMAEQMRQGNAKGCEHAKELLVTTPKLQHNRALEEAAHRFLIPASRSRDVVTNACTQQGLLHLYKSHSHQ